MLSGLMILSLSACEFSFGGEEAEDTDTVETGSTEEEEMEEEPSSVMTDKEIYEPGEEIEVTFTINSEDQEEVAENAWVGIVPSETAHGSESDGDAVDVAYRYLEGDIGGTRTMNAPSEAGEWDVRVYSSDSNGVEIATYSFMVEGEEEMEEQEETEEEEMEAVGEATLSLEVTEYAPGEDVTVEFTAPADFDTTAWVGLIPSDVEHGTESENDANDLAYKYVNGQTSGSMTFTAPEEPGSYDLRMNDTDGTGGVEVASVTFTVVAES